MYRIGRGPQVEHSVILVGGDPAESLADGLANYAAVDTYLAPLPCLQGMLRARGPAAFALDACAAEIDEMAEGLKREMAAAKEARPAGWTLNASECAGL